MISAMSSPAFALALLLADVAFTASADESYCHDPATERQWDRLSLQYEAGVGIKYLYRLRKDICAATDAGRMTLRQGIERFERERQKVIQQKRERNNQTSRRRRRLVLG